MRKIHIFIAVLIITLTSHVLLAQSITHTVKVGETLQSIASVYNTTWDAIAIENGITNPNAIRAGQVLVIPTQNTPRSGSTGSYIVQRGDTLSTIATKYGVTVDALVSVNRITRGTVIYPGDRLTIPTGTVAQPPTNIPTYPTYSAPHWHYILPGQTMLQISMLYGVNPWAIAQANGIYNLNLIYSGTWLYIP